MSRIYRKSMNVYFSFPSVHRRRRRRIFISTLISHQPTVPPDCLCSCPHRYDIKIITLALTPTVSDSTTLIFMFVPCISSNVSQKCIQKSIRAFSQMQKRAKSVSRLTTPTQLGLMMYFASFSHTTAVSFELCHELRHVTAAFGGFTILRALSSGVYNTQRRRRRLNTKCIVIVASPEERHTLTDSNDDDDDLLENRVHSFPYFVRRWRLCLCSKTLAFFYSCAAG